MGSTRLGATPGGGGGLRHRHPLGRDGHGGPAFALEQRLAAEKRAAQGRVRHQDAAASAHSSTRASALRPNLDQVVRDLAQRATRSLVALGLANIF